MPGLVDEATGEIALDADDSAVAGRVLASGGRVLAVRRGDIPQ